MVKSRRHITVKSVTPDRNFGRNDSEYSGGFIHPFSDVIKYYIECKGTITTGIIMNFDKLFESS